MTEKCVTMEEDDDDKLESERNSELGLEGRHVPPNADVEFHRRIYLKWIYALWMIQFCC
jgi:hypothetical protein